MKCEHCGKEINGSEFVNKMAEFGANLMAASYYNLMQKQISEKPKSGVSVKIENDLYSERQTNTSHLRQIVEIQKDFDKKLQEVKKQHIQEIKEATKKARKRQTKQNIDLVVESKSDWVVIEKKRIEEIENEVFPKPFTDSQIIEMQNNKISEQLKQIASLQDQLEYQSSMASLFARKLQEVWNMQDDIIDKINNNSEDNYITIESFVKKLQEIKNIIPAECDKWDKKKSTVYLFEYVSKLMDNGYQILIKQDCTLKNYDYEIELYPEGVCYVFDYKDEDNKFIVLWEDLNE